MKNHSPVKKPPRKILIITMRHLGDVLLSTPLVHSLRKSFPDAQLDFLLFRSTSGMLEGNPDIDHIISVSQRPGFTEILQLCKRLFRRYDIAITTQTGDRPFWFAFLAAPMRIAVVPSKSQTGWWKRFLLQHWLEFDDHDTHTVLQNLKLLEPLSAMRCYNVIPPTSNRSLPLQLQRGSYAVIHPYPLRVYKRWTMKGWIEIANFLRQAGLQLVLSGGPAPEEHAYIAQLHRQLPADTHNLAGQTSLAQLSDIIAGARIFIGPDTGTTHLAAATGIPVIAIYGPTNPVKWAPWPVDYESRHNPFQRVGSQQVNNILLIQGEGDCVPCDLEGCDRHRDSHSKCLDELCAGRVIQAVREALQLDA